MPPYYQRGQHTPCRVGRAQGGICYSCRHVLNIVSVHGMTIVSQGTQCTGKTGKMTPTNPCQGKHRQFGNLLLNDICSYAQVVNSRILKIEDIAIFATKLSDSLNSVWLMKLSQISEI